MRENQIGTSCNDSHLHREVLQLENLKENVQTNMELGILCWFCFRMRKQLLEEKKSHFGAKHYHNLTCVALTSATVSNEKEIMATCFRTCATIKILRIGDDFVFAVGFFCDWSRIFTY